MESTSGKPTSVNPGEQSSNNSASGRVMRQQHLVRLHLQDPTSPAFGNPTRAAELAGLLPSPALLSTSSSKIFRDSLTIEQIVAEQNAHRASLLKAIRAAVIDGLGATKFTTVVDEAGNLQRVQIPDHAARLRWAQFGATMECFMPGKATDPMMAKLPHDAIEFARRQRELLNPDDLQTKLNNIPPAVYFRISEALMQCEELDRLIEEQVRYEEFGPNIDERVKRKVNERIREFYADIFPANKTGGESNE